MENQEIMDQFLENRQNYMMDNSMQHMNVASADCDAVVGGLQAEVVSAGVGGVTGEILGGKYDEHQEKHDVGDDEEWKYVKEVQQSEKQQQQLQTLKNFSLEDDDDGKYKCNELAEKETSNNAALEFGNGGFVFGGDHQQQPQQHRDLFNIGNGHDTNGHDNVNIKEEFGNLVSTGFEKKLNTMESDIDDFKNEGDFSSTSNVTEFVEGFVPKVDVKIETKVENQVEMIDEEEPSSLATNTTNGTSSLSENVHPQAVLAPLTNIFDDFMGDLENKENSDPLTPQRPNELDLDQAHSQLNPDAKEFVPSFGSNPASPTSPFATGVPQQNETILSDIMETQIFGQAPRAVAHHLLGDDDFVAQSPRKGKDDNNMDTVSLPKELSEFEQEADKRPHELEPQDIDCFHQRDEVMTPDQATQQLPLDDVVIQDKENEHIMDSTDFQPPTFMDHGPETCVDHDADLDVQPSAVLSSLQDDDDDVMKRSMYVASDDAIENVLNSVQPIPTEIDSVNNSFIEESATESAANQLAGDKELLQIEEKENVSHSPSTEEIQMNLQNTLFNSSNKDIPQLPIDMDNAKIMQESIYLEQEAQLEFDQEHDKQFRVEEQPFKHEQISIEQDQQQQLQVEEQHLQETIQHEEQQEQGQLQHDIQSELDQILLNQDLLAEKSQNKDETQTFQEEHITEKEREEPTLDLQKDEQEHFKNQIQAEPHQDQQLLEPLTSEQHEDIHDLDKQPTQNLMADTSTYEAKDSLLAGTTNPLIVNDNFLDNSPATQEQQQEIHESFSPFKITDEVSNTPALNFDAPENQQETNLNDITTPLFTADEKHLLEETKEQLLFSMHGLEQQMGEMMLNNTDGHLSQAEEVAATTAVIATENISDQLITTDEAIASEEQYDHHQSQELEQTQDQMFADDSFFQNEQKCLKQYQQEQEDDKEREIVKQEQIEPETEYVLESLESPTEQQPQLEFESEMVAVEEPIIEAKQTAPLFTTTEETEIVNETKIDENKGNMEEISEMLPSMLPETAPAVLLERQPITMDTQNEIDIVKNELEETPAQKAYEEIKTEITETVPELEEFNTNEEECVKEVVATPEVKPDIPVEAAVAVATVAVATISAVAAKIASAPSNNKADTAKKSLSKTTTTAAKTKVSSAPAAKKPIEATKKPVGLTAKPRAAPAKPASTTADKKPIAKTASTTATTAARKPLSATSTAASKLVAKTTTQTSTARTATAAPKTATTSRPTTAPRTTTTTTTAARKPTTSTNGPSAKPRPASAPAKPTTLGLSATNGAPKTKPTSPRSTLSSQVRKPSSAPTAAKSPVKSTATNGVNKTASTLATKTKTTTSTVSSTAGSAGKTFTARPAPKFNSSSSTTTTTTTAKRLTIGGTTTSSTTTSKTSSSPLRKSSPTKSSAGRTPTKSTTTAGSLKSKAPATKTSSATPPAKPAPIRKPVDKSAAVLNGDANVNKDLNGTVEKVAAPAEEQLQQAIPQNGGLQAVQQNGDTNIPMQTEEQQKQSYQSRDDQIPMDLINA